MSLITASAKAVEQTALIPSSINTSTCERRHRNFLQYVNYSVNFGTQLELEVKAEKNAPMKVENWKPLSHNCLDRSVRLHCSPLGVWACGQV